MDLEPKSSSLATLLRYHAEHRPEAEALLSPGTLPLTYRRLWQQVQKTAVCLQQAGLDRRDRIAVVMPDGVAAAVAQMAAASFAVACPFNPAYRQAEFEAFFTDLESKSVILQEGAVTEARAAARSLGVPALEFPSAPGLDAGIVASSPTDTRSPRPFDGWSDPEDVAYVLFTSGSTAKPKRVALKHRNLMVAAAAISRCYRLSLDDRCLNLVPLFHGFGLVSGLLSSFWAGASVICGPALHAANFTSLVGEWQPTWFTGVPAMHRTMVDQLRSQGTILPPNRLRFTISRAGPLSSSLQADVEQVLRIPILQGYGATETSTLATCTALPPETRKPGSVGQTIGPEIAIADEQCRPLAAGATGEVLIRGANVVDDYEDAPEQTRQSFFEGWFRTGDLGHVDGDGYLFITGRKKEVINRGGEKISPYEVEDVLLRHSAVAEAACFPIPHPRLGEDVAAAVVLRPAPVPGASLNGAGEPGGAMDQGAARLQDIAEFAAGRLASFKRPRVIIPVPAIPVTSAGKVSRAQLAPLLARQLSAIPAAREISPPRTPMERDLVELWSKMLGSDRVGIRDSFYDIGGDSLLAVGMLTQVESRFGRPIPVDQFARTPTIESLAKLVSGAAPAAESPLLAPIQTSGSRPPLFNVIAGFYISHEQRLSRYLGADQPYYAVIPDLRRGGAEYGLGPAGVAANCVAAIRAVQPRGPYFLSGNSVGGVVAFHIAQQFAAAGESVGLLALLDTHFPGYPKRNLAPGLLGAVDLHLGNLLTRPRSQWLKYILIELRSVLRRWLHLPPPPWVGTGTLLYTGLNEMPVLEPPPYPGRIVMFFAEDSTHRGTHDGRMQWSKVAQQGLEVCAVPGAHSTMTEEPHARELARALRRYLDAAQTGSSDVSESVDQCIDG